MVLIAAVGAACAGPTDPQEAAPDRFVEAPDVSTDARALYGESAQQAHRELAEFVLGESLTPPLLDPQKTEVSSAQLSEGIVEHFTPEARSEWLRLVDQALAGDEAAAEGVKILRFYDWQSPESTLPDRDSPVIRQSVTGGTVDVAPATAEGVVPLEVFFRHDAQVVLELESVPYDVTLTRLLTFLVVPSPSTVAGDSGDETGSMSGAGSSVGALWLIQDYSGELVIAVDGDERTDNGSDTDTAVSTR